MDPQKTAAVNHSQTIQEHELVVDGTELKESRVVDHLRREGEEEPYQTTTVHVRWIDGSYYKVEEVTNRRVSTSLDDDDQVEAFQQEWADKWMPAMEEELVDQAQQAEASQPEIQE